MNLMVWQLPHPEQLNHLPHSEQEKVLQKAWLMFTEGDFQQRWEVAKLLPQFGASAIAPLKSLLEAEQANLDLRCEAAAILSKINQPEAVFALTTVLKTETDVEVVTACLNALVNTGTDSIPFLIEALADSRKRLPAVEALAYLRKPETITPLLQVIEDEQWEVRVTAIEALSSFRDPRIIPALINALSDVQAMVRKEAVVALGVRGSNFDHEAVVNALRPRLYDLNLEVCRQSAIALGRINTPSALDGLRDCLQSSLTPAPLKQQLVIVLSQHESEENLSVLKAALWQESFSITQEIIAKLGRWQQSHLKKPIVEALTVYFYDHQFARDNIVLKQTLATALGNLGIADGKNLLLALAEDESRVVRLHAQVALKKLPETSKSMKLNSL